MDEKYCRVSPLLHATSNNNVEMVKTIIEYANSKNIKLEIFSAFKNNDSEVEKLIIEYANNQNIKLQIFSTIYYNNEFEKVIIENDDDDDDNNNKIENSDNYKEIINYILSMLSSLSRRNIKELVELTYAKFNANENNNTENKILDKEIDLINACKNENEEVIKQLINDGADVNMTNGSGDTPLTISCEKENLNIIKYLIENGAKTDINNSMGTSSLNLLCKIKSEKSLEIVNYFIEEKKINIDYKDKNGNTPLLMASYFRDNKVMEKLIENRANINIQNNFGDTSLIISSYFKNKKITQKLVNEGANMDIQNIYGDTFFTISQKNLNKKNNINNSKEKSNKKEKINFESKKSFLEELLNNDNDDDYYDSDVSNSDTESIISYEETLDENLKINLLSKKNFINQCIIGEHYKHLKPNQYINFDYAYYPIVVKARLTYVMKASICIIKIKNSSGTGFFVKLPIPSKERPICGLMTNNHVLNSKNIQPGKSFSIRINKFKKEIVLTENDFIFTSDFIDITFIQLDNAYIEDIILNNPGITMLTPYFDNFNKKDQIYIFQYPKGKLSYAEGKIQSISGFNYFHTASTEGGSSGSPLLNKDMSVIGVHKAGIEEESKNIATNINVIIYAIGTLYNKRYINSLNKAKEPTRKLSEDEIKVLKKHDLKETKFPNLYKCPYTEKPSLIVLFYRTNHAWYYTTKNKKEFKNETDINRIKIYHWNLINVYEPLEKIISRSEEKLEHHHELIIMWLKLSDLMYM
jgi:ankyrin repeat protein